VSRGEAGRVAPPVSLVTGREALIHAHQPIDLRILHQFIVAIKRLIAMRMKEKLNNYVGKQIKPIAM
jgi:hypothetical protein